MSFSFLDPEVRRVLAKYANNQISTVSETSWTALESKHGCVSDEELKHRLIDEVMTQLCKYAVTQLGKEHVTKLLDTDMRGLKIKASFVAFSLSEIEQLAAELFSAGRLYERRDNAPRISS